MNDLDLVANLNAQDDDGLGWSTLGERGQVLDALVAVDDDGQIHFAILPGAVAKNRHLLEPHSRLTLTHHPAESDSKEGR